MKILNLYFSATGNTEKVAKRIEKTLLEIGHEVETFNVTKDMEVKILQYDLVFMGSGVYTWMPGKPLMVFNIYSSSASRHRNRFTAFMVITTSLLWFSTSMYERTIPRSGFERERLASRTVTRMESLSPGNTGLNQRSSSTPGEPKLATCER